MSVSIIVESFDLEIREGEEKRFFINKLLHDLRDMFGRNSDRSRSIVLPRSPQNVRALGLHAPFLGRDYRPLNCQVLFSGVPVLTDAKLVINSEDKNHYECTIIGGAATFYNRLPEESIRLLDFTADNFEWTLNNYTNRRNNQEGLVTAWAQWITNDSYQRYLDEGGDPTEEVEAVDIDKAGFCYYTRSILEKIFDNTGLEIEFDIDRALDDYNKLVLCCPMPQIFDAHESANSDAGLVGLLADWVVPFNVWTTIPFDDVIINDGGVYDPVNFWYSPTETMGLRLTATIKRNARVIGADLFVRLIKIPSGGAPEILQTGYWFLNGSLMFFDAFDVGEVGDVYFLEAFSTSANLNYFITAESTGFTFKNQAGVSRDVRISDYLPDITQRQLVKNIFNVFHIVASDSGGKITLSLFDEIQNNSELDINPRVSADRQIKYSPALSNYGQINDFKYKDEPLVISEAFNDQIAIDNNTLPLRVVKIELDFAGLDGSFFSFPGQVVPMFSINYQREDNNKIQIQNGGGGTFATYNTNDSNELTDNDVIFVPGSPGRFVVKRTFDNKHGELWYTASINENDLDWTFLHYEKNAHEYQLAIARTDPNTTFIYYENSERQLHAGAEYVDVLTWDYLLGKYYPDYRLMIRDFQVVQVWADIPKSLFLELSSKNPIYFNSDKYYLNKTEQYKEDGLTRLELVKYN